MLITTTPGIEGRPVTEYLGIVTAQGVLGVNAFKDVSAGVRNIFGGRAKSYENELASGVSDALTELEKQAARLGADAVVGVDVDYETGEQHADGERLRDGGEAGGPVTGIGTHAVKTPRQTASQCCCNPSRSAAGQTGAGGSQTTGPSAGEREGRDCRDCPEYCLLTLRRQQGRVRAKAFRTAPVASAQ